MKPSILTVMLLLPPAMADQLGYHEIKTDSSGKIAPWYGTGPSQAYDHDIRLLFAFWKNMRKCPNGVPMYNFAEDSFVFRENLFGDQPGKRPKFYPIAKKCRARVLRHPPRFESSDSGDKHGLDYTSRLFCSTAQS